MLRALASVEKYPTPLFAPNNNVALTGTPDGSTFSALPKPTIMRIPEVPKDPPLQSYSSPWSSITLVCSSRFHALIARDLSLVLFVMKTLQTSC